MPDWIVISATITALSSIGFAVMAILWIKRTRGIMAKVLGEAVTQQVSTAQRFGDAISHLHKQQKQHDEQIAALTQSNIKLRQELSALAHERQELARPSSFQGVPTIH